MPLSHMPLAAGRTRRDSGFTLMELLLYIAIVVIVTVVIANTFIALNKGRGKAEARSEVSGNLRFAIERISQDLRAASAATMPASPGGTTSSTLVLTHPTDGTVTYCVVTGTLYRAKNGAACNASADAITGSTVTIGTPTFTRLENTNAVFSKTIGSIQISLSASYNSSSPDWQYSQTKQTTLALQTPYAPPSISYVQHVGTVTDSSLGTLSLTVTVPASGVATGNHLVVAILTKHDALRTITVTDSRGNAYNLDREDKGSTSRDLSIFSGRIATALLSGDLVTATFSTSAAESSLMVHEYRGLAATAWLDLATSTTGAANPVSSGAIATTQSNELLIGFVGAGYGAGENFVPDAPWPNPERDEVDIGARGDSLNERIVSSTGSYAITGSFVVGGAWSALIVAYKGAPPG